MGRGVDRSVKPRKRYDGEDGMKKIKGDILSVTSGIICHQVNCMGVMGAGIALKIRNKYPKAYNDYREFYRKGKLVMGAVILSPVSESLYVAHLCGQYKYGTYGNYTDYDAVKECLNRVVEYSRAHQHQVFIPKGMGCKLAGGDWKIVSKLIKEVIPEAVIVEYEAQ
jgi:O-acetyl-ADP-ribose deacetylase (regulator of RNase III)